MAGNRKRDFASSQGPGDGTGCGCEEKHPCDGCYYWRGNAEWSRCCNYVFDEDRLRPCEPGEGCLVRRESTARERMLAMKNSLFE